VPSLLAGAAYGHLWYQLLDEAGVNALQPEIHPGLFTLVGAASLLGGMARMTISLAVILLELTGVINWGPPVMIALLSARWVGNAFNEGLYDIHVHLNGYDFLEYKPSTDAKSHQLLVHHVMTAAPVCVAEVVRAGDLLDMLQRNSHNGFPVIPCEDPYEHNDAAVRRRNSSAAADEGPPPALQSVNRASSMRSPSGIHLADVARNFSGIVMRKHLCVALARLDLQPMRGIHKAAPAAKASAASNPAAGAGEQTDDGEGQDQFDGEGRDRFVPLEGEADDPPMPFPYTRMPRPEAGSDYAAFRDVVGEGSGGSGGGGGGERSAAASLARWSKRHTAPSHAPDDEALHFPDLERSFPRYPLAADITLTPAQRCLWLDITPYINATPPVVFTDAPVKRAFSLFRGLGMRHLVAVDRNNNVSGIITRHDLTNHRLSHVAAKQSTHSANKVRHTYTPDVPVLKQRGRRKRKSSYAPEPVGLTMRK
jgi:CBS domain-containing protein